MVITRTVEMAICYSDGTWQCGHFVDIPVDTADDKVEKVARKVLLSLVGSASDIAAVFLYNSMGDNSAEEACSF